MKTKGQHPRVAKLEMPAFVLFCPCSSAEKGVKPGPSSKVGPDSRPQERPPAKRNVAGSNPARGTTSISPAGSFSYQQGLTSGLRQRRSEEHTSELQSLRHLVCRLL